MRRQPIRRRSQLHRPDPNFRRSALDVDEHEHSVALIAAKLEPEEIDSAGLASSR
jgi:hypothetical protein